MRSVPSDGDRSAADLTARARIRDAAIARFAEDGFSVGLRAIAADAGTSVGLVAHHFGSKAGLRAACDEHALITMRDLKKDTLTGDIGGATLLAQLAAVEEYGPLTRYVLRTLQEGGENARSFVEHAAEGARENLASGVAAGTIVPSRDEDARTRYLIHQSLGALVLTFAIDPVRPGETFADWFRRYADGVVGPALETMTEGLLTDRTLLDTYLAARGGTTETEQP